MAYDINKDPNIVMSYGDGTYKRKDGERVDKYGVVIKQGETLASTPKPKFNLFDFQTKVAGTNINKVIPSTTAIATKVEPKRNIFTPSSPASMVKPVTPTTPTTGIPGIPTASANEKDLIQTYFDDKTQDIENKKTFVQMLKDGVPSTEIEDILVNKIKYKPIQPKEENVAEKGLISSLQGRVQDIKGADKLSNLQVGPISEKQLQQFGALGGAFGDIVSYGIGKAIPDDWKESLANSGVGKGVIQRAELGGDLWDLVKKASPRGAKAVENFVNAQNLVIGGPSATAVAKQAPKIVTTPIAKTGTLIKKSGEALYKTAIKPDVNEAELLLRSKAGLGESPITRADTALKLGLTGTETGLGVKSLKEADKIFKKTIGPAIEQSKRVHNIDDLFKKVEDKIRTEGKGELRTKDLLEGLEALKEDYIGLSKTFNTKALQIEKSSLDEFTPQKIFKGKDVANGYNQVKNTFANVIREQVRDDLGKVGIPNAKELYRDYANLTELSKIGIKGLTEGGLKGGFGTFWSTLYDKLATPIKTIGGKVLYRTGEGLEFIGPKGIKKVGDYLKLNKLEIDKNNIINKVKNDNNLTDIKPISSNISSGMDRNIIKPKQTFRQITGRDITPPTSDKGKTILKPKVETKKPRVLK